MTTTIKIALLGIVSILCYQCTPDPIDIEIPEREPQIVVASQVVPDNVIAVALTKTIGALDFSETEGDTVDTNLIDQIVVGGANVTVSYSGQTDELFEVIPGFYTSLNTLQVPNEAYTLNIETADGKSLSSTSRMLPQVAFADVMPNILRTEEDTIVRLEYAINDPAEQNWYMLNIYRQTEETEIDSLSAEFNNILSLGNNSNTTTILLSDQIFENPKHEDIVELFNFEPTDIIIVTLSNISEDYYNFLSLRKTSESLLTEITKEPINYPTNIEGGIGFFNTHFPDLTGFDLNDY